MSSILDLVPDLWILVLEMWVLMFELWIQRVSTVKSQGQDSRKTQLFIRKILVHLFEDLKPMIA
ncbi:hypothetical protein BOTCAL_0012g00020 [Botryotinia calthae]|uniref:Uncharacterized protein n=1 Tax=Botryotinia calthae TaxID=38488 RepID=A0A4Y8DIX8_9HELO|nr:hypothetical protein BOTCAL_0012g00020 [Botryotinia calthae]